MAACGTAAFAAMACTPTTASVGAPADEVDAGAQGSGIPGVGSIDGGGGPCTKCGSVCVDTGSDRQHCGGCYRPCGEGLACTSGTCTRASRTVVLEEVYRKGYIEANLRAGGFGMAVLDDVLHFEIPDNSHQRYRCDKNRCSATIEPSSASKYVSQRPIGATRYGYFSNGTFHLDPWLRAPRPLTLPPTTVGGDRYTYLADRVVFWGCANRSLTSCGPSQGNQTAEYTLYECPRGGCADYSNAVAITSQRCFLERPDCLPIHHPLSFPSGTELVLSGYRSILCTRETLDACTRHEITLPSGETVNSLIGEDLAISGDVLLGPDLESGRLTAIYPDRKPSRVTLPEGVVGIPVAAGEGRRFVVRRAPAAIDFDLVVLDEKGSSTVERLELEPRPASLATVVGFAADATHMYITYVERNAFGDRFATVYRGKL
jgi:hypothetical protein